MKVPAIIACSIVCLVLGLGVGAAGATLSGLTTDGLWFWKGTRKVTDDDTKVIGLMDMMPKDGAPPPMPGMPGKDGKKGGGKGGGKGPSAKMQLNALVAKLDVLTQKPLTVTLDVEQKKKVHEQLQGLAAMEDLTEDEAQKRLNGLLEVVKDQQETLTMAGFRWPGEKGGAGFGKEVANPFTEEANARHLESLEKRVSKSAP